MNHTISIDTFFRNNKYKISFLFVFIIYLINLFIDVMEVDAAQYANISMEMSINRSFLHVYENGRDYLDKPPLLFWMSSLSMMVFGINNFAYKFPSLLIAILGIYSTYKYARIYYSKEVSSLAALILATSQALFLMTNDVRTDTALLGLNMFGIWQLTIFLERRNGWSLIGAALGIGFAMLAKGPIAFIIPFFAVGSYIIIKREWKQILDYRWLIMILVIAIILFPMSYGLFTQYDLHPEKEAYGLKGPSGLKFYYWTQSFGRITGENQWKNNAGYLFFTHTILWDFFPWILIFIPAFIHKIRTFIEQKFKISGRVEVISLPVFILVFIAFSLSRYKLPHYIFVILPFASIITADFIYLSRTKNLKLFSSIYFVLMHLVWIGIPMAYLFFFPNYNPILYVIYAIGIIVFYYLNKKLKGVERLLMIIIVTILVLNFNMALYFYPNLLQYQSSSNIGKFIKNEIPKNIPVFSFQVYNNAIQFYSQRVIKNVDANIFSRNNNAFYLITNEEGLAQIDAQKISYKKIQTYPQFHITALKFPFLLRGKRDEIIENRYLLFINFSNDSTF